MMYQGIAVLLMMLVTVVLPIQMIASTNAGSARKIHRGITFSQSSDTVKVYDFVEVTVKVDRPAVNNPFTDVRIKGHFQAKSGKPVPVEGFCDSRDGSIFRIRFMPTKPGVYSYSVAYRQGQTEERHNGTFKAVSGKRRGLVRVDKEYPWHFIWEGTGEHYFWNGTTAYFLAGWDERGIFEAIDRLHKLKVNRIRAALSGRVKDGRAWYENVFPTSRFSFLLNPWEAKRPQSVEDPGFDVTRFNVSFWQKFEKLLLYARERDIVISVVFYVDGKRPGTDPFGKSGMGGPDEQRYYRYAVSRFSAYSNVMWDLANEYRFFRDDSWTEKMGKLMKEWDPYDHLTSVHGFSTFNFRKSPWADLAMYQEWDQYGGYDFMLGNRKEQASLGRPIPQVNEEYGYEDHYPTWGGNLKSPARSADNRRRLAWEMYMAGGYQTAGERADRGTGWGPDSGGGWINGRGDDTMILFKGYRHIVDFFTGFSWWKTEPRDDLVSKNAYCLAEPGKLYVVYLPKGGSAQVKLESGRYKARWYNPRTGRFTKSSDVSGPVWTSPESKDEEDWVILIQRQ